jgi:hypothetical protein
MVDGTALTALIIAIIAFIVAVGQVLQQYFATADGYRRCQPSVMGGWALKTKLRFRWRELRFETLYAVPRIEMDIKVSVAAMEFLEDQPISPRAKRFSNNDLLASSLGPQYDELAGWVILVTRLRGHYESIIQSPLEQTGFIQHRVSFPRLRVVNKSWDFMPSGIVRPLAISNVGDIAICARRLNLEWKQFEPDIGKMAAEGDGQVITSTIVPFVGMILHYTWTKAGREYQTKARYIPSLHADMLGFGVIDTSWSLFKGWGDEMPNLLVGSHRDITTTLSNLFGIIGRAEEILLLADRVLESPGAAADEWMASFNDLVPMCSPTISRFGMSQRRVPCPNVFARGITHTGFGDFADELDKLVAADRQDKIIKHGGAPPSRQAYNIQTLYKRLKVIYTDWENVKSWDRALSTNVASDWGKDVQHALNMATDYLESCAIHYPVLVAEHISLVLSKEEYFYKPGVSKMQRYFESLPQLCSNILHYAAENRLRVTTPVNDPGYWTAEMIEDAWITMIFRAMCWQRAHYMEQGIPPIPSQHWGSKMPVYIG